MVYLAVSEGTIFVLLPFGLPLLGVSRLTSFAFSLYVLGVLLDGLTTKVGLALGLKEASLLYPIVRRYLSENLELILSRIAGIGWGVVLLVFFPDPTLILLFASLMFVPVLMNAISLLCFVSNLSKPKIE